jgi:hypothetical protein
LDYSGISNWITTYGISNWIIKKVFLLDYTSISYWITRVFQTGLSRTFLLEYSSIFNWITLTFLLDYLACVFVFATSTDHGVGIPGQTVSQHLRANTLTHHLDLNHLKQI